MAVSLSYFKTRTRVAPDWVITNWLKRRNTGFILGEPKRACKSWLLLNLAWELSEGKPAWGIKHTKDGYLFPTSRPMRTVYFTQEDTDDDFHDRALLHFSRGREDNDRLWISTKDLSRIFTSPAGRAALSRELDDVVAKAGPIDLIILDPMRRMHDGNENDSQVISAMFTEIDKYHNRYNCATIFAHHTIKPPRDSMSTFDMTSPQAGRGSGDIYGGGDAFIVVKPVNVGRGRPSRLRRHLELHFETKRAQPLEPVRMVVDFSTGSSEFEGFLTGRKGEDEGESE